MASLLEILMALIIPMDMAIGGEVVATIILTLKSVRSTYESIDRSDLELVGRNPSIMQF